MAAHVRYKSLSSAKQPLEITKFYELGGTRTATHNLELNALSAYLARGRLLSHWRSEEKT